jgi:hypothetical protein
MASATAPYYTGSCSAVAPTHVRFEAIAGTSNTWGGWCVGEIMFFDSTGIQLAMTGSAATADTTQGGSFVPSAAFEFPANYPNDYCSSTTAGSVGWLQVPVTAPKSISFYRLCRDAAADIPTHWNVKVYYNI